MTTFGPRLIGSTEKTLNALLRHVLVDENLDEPQWVTLRLAEQRDTTASLTDVVRDRAHIDAAAEVVASLRRRGLVIDDELSAQGRELVDRLQARIASLTRPVWQDLEARDVAAAERVLASVARRANLVLDSLKD